MGGRDSITKSSGRDIYCIYKAERRKKALVGGVDEGAIREGREIGKEKGER